MTAELNLLYHIFSAVKAFQDDLKELGLADRVLTLTMSEFGRRAASNNSWGTDHGTAAPMFVFGKGVKPGVIGTNPNLMDLDHGNIKMQHDYRQVMNEIANDWFCATASEKEAINFNQDKANPKGKIGTSCRNIQLSGMVRTSNLTPVVPKAIRFGGWVRMMELICGFS